MTAQSHPMSKFRYIWARFCQEIVGLAQDYWHDGAWDKSAQPDPSFAAEVAAASTPARATPTTLSEEGLWTPLAGEISEKMWGPRCVTPGDVAITEQLIRPLGLNKDHSVLDLSAGLGARLMRTTKEFGVYITGMEPDPEVAARGRALAVAAGKGKKVTIDAYDPANLISARTYDCILARETIYRIADKEKFIKSIAACSKAKAQFSFTDYIVDPEMADKPAILAWKAFEPGADPCSLVRMAELLAQNGFTLRVHDDQTAYYKKEIVKGLANLALFLNSGVKPSTEAKKIINKRLKLWVHRASALEAGMKFYRFYALR